MNRCLRLRFSGALLLDRGLDHLRRLRRAEGWSKRLRQPDVSRQVRRNFLFSKRRAQRAETGADSRFGPGGRRHHLGLLVLPILLEGLRALLGSSDIFLVAGRRCKLQRLLSAPWSRRRARRLRFHHRAGATHHTAAQGRR